MICEQTRKRQGNDLVKKSIVTNITQHDASLAQSVEVTGNRIYTMKEKELQAQIPVDGFCQAHSNPHTVTQFIQDHHQQQ